MFKRSHALSHIIPIRTIHDNCITLSLRRKRWIYRVTPITYSLLPLSEQQLSIQRWKKVLQTLPCAIQLFMLSSKASYDDYEDIFAINKGNETYIAQLRTFIAKGQCMKQEFYLVAEDEAQFASMIPLFQNAGMSIMKPTSQEIINIFHRLCHYDTTIPA